MSGWACRCCRSSLAWKKHGVQILIYSVLLVPIAMTPWFIGPWRCDISRNLGSAWGGLSCGTPLTFTRIREEGAGADARAKRLFLFSIFYLFALFAVILLEHTTMRLMGWLV